MRYPSLAAVHEEAARCGRAEVYGRSVEGRDLLAVEIGDGERLVMVTAGLHGLELIGVQVALAVLRAGAPPGTRLLVCPVLNPDGYSATIDGQPRRTNARGVDLNRNFPLPWDARPSGWSWLGAGSSRLGDATYRGEGPLSEPESAALAALIDDRRPHASVNLHSFLGVLIPARVWQAADWVAYGRLARAFRRGQGGLGYPRVGAPLGDVFTGELEDWQHHAMRCWAVCVECFSLVESLREHLRAPDLVARFNPRDPGPVVARDAAGARALLAAAAELPPVPERTGSAITRRRW